MTIRNKIVLLFFPSIIILAIVLYFFRITQEQQHSLVVKSAAEQQVVLINTAINVQSDQLDQLITDYTNWDEIIINLKVPNCKWAEDNIASSIKSFNLYKVRVFNSDKQLVYGFGKKDENISGDSKLYQLAIETILKKGAIHYYQISPEGLLELSLIHI